MLQRLANRLAGGGLIKPCRLVLASHNGRLAVGAQCPDQRSVLTLERRAHQLAGGGIPQPCFCPVHRQGDLGVVAQGYSENATEMMPRWSKRRAGDRVP